MKNITLVTSGTSQGEGLLLPPDDLLRGAAAIAIFLLNDPKQRRAIYHMFETRRLPAFRLGTRIYARKSTLMRWIAGLERTTEQRADASNDDAQSDQ
jgi:hypothetical protein